MTRHTMLIDGEETPINVSTGVHPNGLFAQMAAIKAVLQNPKAVARFNRWWLRPILRMSRIVITMPWDDVVLEPLWKAVFLDELRKASQTPARGQ
jgi:hypothetical protein